jgi:hypothetical protein
MLSRGSCATGNLASYSYSSRSALALSTAKPSPKAAGGRVHRTVRARVEDA